jgi:cell division GTPase FtsZ
MAINTAMVDLSGLDQLESSEKIHLLGYEGAGKDRSIGLEAFLEHKEKIRERINEMYKDCHIIFPVAALGGGTGSGMIAPCVDLLIEMFESKVVSPIVFTPYKKESKRAIMNALEAFSELSLIEDIGSLFIIDNQKVLERFQEVSLKEKFKRSNEQIIGMIDLYNKRTNQESSVSNLDQMDLLTVLSERGSAIFSGFGIGEDHIDNGKKMAEKLKKSWSHSIYAETDTNKILRAAFVVDIPEELTKKLQVDSFFDEIGKPLEVFSGIFDSNDARLYTLITGLSFPTRLLKELEESVQKDEKQIIETMDGARTQSFTVKSSWTESLKRKRRVKI